MEKWKDLAFIGYPDYQVSNCGRVYSICTKRVLQPFIVNGYLTVRLFNMYYKRNRTIHQLVALAFLPNPEKCKVVRHKDTIRTNNSIGNLEWVTHKMLASLKFKSRR